MVRQPQQLRRRRLHRPPGAGAGDTNADTNSYSYTNSYGYAYTYTQADAYTEDCANTKASPDTSAKTVVNRFWGASITLVPPGFAGRPFLTVRSIMIE